MAENILLEKVLLGDTTKEYVDKINKAIDNVNSNADAIENLTGAVANAGKVDDVKVNDISVVSNKIANVKVNGSDTVKVETSGTGEITISAPTLAKSLTLSVDPSTYVLTATLKDSNDKDLSTQTVDLPLETMVVEAAYDDSTKEIVLTLQDRTQTRFSVADLVAGLVATDKNFTDGQVLVADGNGKKAKSSGFTIKTSVPANAKFTDTTYENATTSKSGLMSSTDKAKLDRIDSSLEGVTADQIGKVKDVQVNSTSVLGSDGVANITIDDLKAGYVSVSSSSLVDCVVGGTTYKAIKVADTDTELEVYNSAGNKILTHTVREEGYLYICVGTTPISCTLRKINGNSVGSGSTGGSQNLEIIRIDKNLSSTVGTLLPLEHYAGLLLIDVYDSVGKKFKQVKRFFGKNNDAMFTADREFTINYDGETSGYFILKYIDREDKVYLYKDINIPDYHTINDILLLKFKI